MFSLYLTRDEPDKASSELVVQAARTELHPKRS